MRAFFQYVDFTKEKKHKETWRRILITNITKHSEMCDNYNLFTTIQRFKEPIVDTDEVHWCPIFFDFDSEDSVEKAKVDAIKVVEFFRQIGVSKECIRIWWSGKKGFHVLIEPEQFNIKPHKELTRQIKHFCCFVKEKLEIKSTPEGSFDATVYTKRRLWRIPNSIHLDTGLFCLEITPEELKSLKIEEIKELAKKPRDAFYTDADYIEMQPEKHLEDLWNIFVTEYNNILDIQRLKPKNPVQVDAPIPDCVKDIMDNSIRKQGTRNRALMVLASFYKDMGKTQEETTAMLIEWSKKIPVEFSRSTEPDRISNAKSVTGCIYADKNYHFSCAFIRALGVLTSKPVMCLFEDCKTTTITDQEVVEPIEVALHESTYAQFVNIPLVIQAMVSGKDSTPYDAPSEILVECKPKMEGKTKCLNCKVGLAGGKKSHRISRDSPLLLELISVRVQEVNALLKNMMGIPQTCYSLEMSILSRYNLHDIQLIPELKFTPSDLLSEKEYIVRRGIYVGKSIQTSKEYRFKAFHYPDPKTQYALLLLTESQLLESDIKEPGDLKSLDIFRVEEESIAGILSKLENIYYDLEHNITGIIKRQDLHLALDLAFHSVIGFTLLKENWIRGWIDCMILGDSSVGKTQVAERLIAHYQAGSMVSGESARRTGLTYNFQQTGKRWFLQWGIIPLNDMRLVIIDEFGELDDKIIEEMSRVRSSGIIETFGVIKAKTPARTRKVFLSNLRGGRTLSQINYGIRGLCMIFKQPEDIRRLDFCLAISNTELDLKNIDLRAGHVQHIYNSKVCSDLIKWAWSRRPEDVVFEDDVTEAIFRGVDFLTDRYTNDIPLVEPADQRWKIGRIAVALACRLFSTDKERTKVIVKKYHIEFVVGWLHSIYKRSSMQYELYTTMVRGEKITDELKETVKADLRRILLDKNNISIFLNTILYSPKFRRKQLEEQLDVSKEIMSDLFLLLSKFRLIESTPVGFIAKPTLLTMLKEMSQEE